MLVLVPGLGPRQATDQQRQKTEVCSYALLVHRLLVLVPIPGLGDSTVRGRRCLGLTLLTLSWCLASLYLDSVLPLPFRQSQARTRTRTRTAQYVGVRGSRQGRCSLDPDSTPSIGERYNDKKKPNCPLVPVSLIAAAPVSLHTSLTSKRNPSLGRE